MEEAVTVGAATKLATQTFKENDNQTLPVKLISGRVNIIIIPEVVLRLYIKLFVFLHVHRLI